MAESWSRAFEKAVDSKNHRVNGRIWSHVHERVELTLKKHSVNGRSSVSWILKEQVTLGSTGWMAKSGVLYLKEAVFDPKRSTG